MARAPGRRPMDTRDLVVSLYVSLLGRRPKGGEELPLVRFVERGGSVEELVQSFLASTELQVEFVRNGVLDGIVAPDPLPPGRLRLYVCHLPKTGGTSLVEMLRPHFTALEFCAGLTLSQLYRMSLYRLRSFRVIAGHYGRTLPQLLYDAPLATATLIRDPVATVMSIYTQHRDRGEDRNPYTQLARELSFDTWCRRGDLTSLWSNPQAKALASIRTPPPSKAADYVPEGSSLAPRDEDELAESALTLLRNMDIVGTTGDLLEVCRACLRLLGIDPTLREARHENAGAGVGADLSPSTAQWLLAHNTVDAALFAEARSRGSRLALGEAGAQHAVAL